MTGMPGRLAVRTEYWFYAGILLLVISVSMSITPFGAPDEPAHYPRAIGVGGLQLVGAEAPWPHGGLTPLQEAWINQATRRVVIAPRIYPLAQCTIYEPDRPATCTDGPTRNGVSPTVITATGTYDPLPYLLSGLMIRASPNSLVGLWLGRLGMALQAILLLWASVWVAPQAMRPTVVLGTSLALTPMVIYTSAALNPSAVEISAGIALSTALLTLEPGHRRGWLVAAVATVMLSLSRSSGVAWSIALTAMAMLWHGRAELVRLVKADKASATLFGFSFVVGVGLNRVWAVLYGPTTSGHVPSLADIDTYYDVFGTTIFKQAIGWFGGFDLPLFWAAYGVWAVTMVCLTLLASGSTNTRHRVVMALTTLGLFVLPPLIWFAVVMETGFGPQARHFLPVLTTFPVLGALLTAEQPGLKSRTRRIVVVMGSGLLIAVGSTHLYAWWLNARRAAVGIDGPAWFVVDPAWSPWPGWWVVWGVLATGGTVLFTTGMVTALRVMIPTDRRGGTP